MDDWILWLIIAVLFAVGEVLTMGFFLAPFAVGAVVAMVIAAAGGSFVVAGLGFLIVSTVAFGALRPVARRHLRLPAELRTGTAALVGKSGTVIETIDRDSGSVRIEGEVWTARPYDEDETFEAGQRVHVLQIRGATALVSE
jgi:membrane protein implicated in regulation of membrane protease activity